MFWFWLTCAVAAVWLKRHIDLNRARLDAPLSPADAETCAGPWPRLSVLVAARDEEKNIGRCIEGLLAQDYPEFTLTVVDDRSSDRTPEIIDQFARRDPRFRAVHVRELRPGWFGKNNAMREGVAAADGEYLCFSDADCAFDSPKLLRAAMAYARREHIDFLSVLPRLEASTFWEQVVQPPAGAIMVFWFPPQKVNDPKSPRAYANGAFMLMSRTAYEAIGGHEFAKATLNEDMHFARRAKQVGLRLRVIRGGDLYRVRMYTGFPQIWRGWSRIFYGCFGTFPRLLASVLFLSIVSLSPYATLLASPFAGVSAIPAAGAPGSSAEGGWEFPVAGPGPWLAGAALAAILAQQSVLWRFYRVSGAPPHWALTYVIGAAVCLGMTLNAMTRVAGRSTNWRGTAYAGGAKPA
jgi:glycosyltransferase involved in cell wall biosynthesis